MLRDYGPFADISASYINKVVAHPIIVPKTCLKPPCEEYATIGMAELQLNFCSFLIINATSPFYDGLFFC